MRRLVAICLALAVLPALACSFSVGTGGEDPRLAEAVVCRDLSDDDAPIDPTEVFSDDDDFHVSVEYFDVEEGQSVGVEWFFEGELWRESSITVDAANVGDGYAVFSLTNSELWPAGSYHVDVYLDGESDHTVEFRVE